MHVDKIWIRELKLAYRAKCEQYDLTATPTYKRNNRKLW